MNEAAGVRTGVILRYAVGSVGTGVYSTVPSILLLYFMTEQLRLPLSLASLAVLLPKLFVIGLDPLIGTWSDRRPGITGKRTPFLVAGALASTLAFVALFHAPRLPSTAATFTTVTGLYFLACVAYSLYAVPYVTLPAELSPSAQVRTRIIGCRMTFVFVGVLLGAAAPPVLVATFGGGRAGYGRMALLIAAVCGVTMLTAALVSRSVPSVTTAVPTNLRAAVRGAAGYREFRWALGFYALTMVAAGAYTAALPYFINSALRLAPAALSTFLLVQLGTSILTMPVWAQLGVRRTRLPLLRDSALCMAAGCLLLWLVPPGALKATALVAAVIAGAGVAGLQVGSFALLADLVRGDAERQEQSREALLTGLWTATERTALAIGPALSAAVLAVVGFSETNSPDHAVRWAVAALPAALLGFAVATLAGLRERLPEGSTCAAFAPNNRH